MSVPFILQDRYKFPENSPLFRALASLPLTSIIDETKAYFLIDILFELFRYAGLNKLYVGRYRIACNEELKSIFQCDSLPAGSAILLLKPHLLIQDAYIIYRPLHDASIREEFMTFIGRTIEQGNNLNPLWSKGQFRLLSLD